jgi:hypothetical protein
MNKPIEQAQEAKSSLLQHTAVMLISCTLLQVVIAVRGNHIDLVSQLLLVCVALYYLWYHASAKNLLSKVRFGRLVAHLIGFLAVNISYHLHAFFLFIAVNPAIKGTGDFPIDPGWFGVLFGMTTFWGIGLLIHMIASIANRGFEELPRG